MLSVLLQTPIFLIALSMFLVIGSSFTLWLFYRSYQRFHLYKQQQIQSTLWQHIPDIITEIDAEGNILDLNHTTIGHDKKEYIGTNSFEHLNEQNKVVFRSALNRAISSQSLQNYDLKIEIGGVEPGFVWLACRLIPIVEHEQVKRLMVVSTDTTNEHVILDKLKQAKIEAEQSSIAKTRFLASMSHEIRTPMTGMLGMASLLQDTKLDLEQREYVDTVQSSANHLLSIVNDILDFSKIEANKLSIEKEPFDNFILLQEVKGLLSARVNEKGLKLSCDIDPAVPQFVLGDSIRIRQVLMNYLTNAVKFTADGEITLKIHLLSMHTDHVKLRYSVEDTGLGISHDKADFLFEEYTGAHDRNAALEGGSGLGLSICQRLAELMGGRVGVISNEGVGSNFWLDLNLNILDAEQIEQEQEKAKQHSLEQSRRHVSHAKNEFSSYDGVVKNQLSVLLAEDNKVNQMVVVKILNRLGCQVECVEHGKAALELCQQKTFDIIFMDCHMPVMDGMSATKEIRALENFEQLPIVALTADVMSECKEQALACGMNDFLSKPVKINDLAQVLSKLFPQLEL